MSIKLVRRICPQCHQTKEYDLRNTYCCRTCSGLAHTKPKSPHPAKRENQEITDTTWAITLPSTHIHTLPQLIEHYQIDTSIWEVDRFLVGKSEIGRKDRETDLEWSRGIMTGTVKDTGRVFVEPLYQVKAWLKKKVHVVDARREIEELRKYAEKFGPRYPKIKRSRRKTDNMLEISIPDLHAGKLAWHKETGWEDYDTRIAERIHDDAVDALIARTSSYKFDQVVFVVGNDLLNSDDAEGRTTLGTYVTTDTRYQKTFGIVRSMIVRAIEKLRVLAPVEVIMVSGNHDRLGVWHLGDSLDAYFHKCDDVHINNEPTSRKYHKFGKVMLMFTHGDKGKKSNYPLLTAVEQRKIWADTTWCEIHTGDLHKVKLDEELGVRVRILPSLTAADDWHAENGFVGNHRSAEAFVWNATQGLVGTAIYTVPAEDGKK